MNRLEHQQPDDSSKQVEKLFDRLVEVGLADSFVSFEDDKPGQIRWTARGENVRKVFAELDALIGPTTGQQKVALWLTLIEPQT